MNRGFAKRSPGDHDRPIADFNRAIELDPEVARLTITTVALAKKARAITTAPSRLHPRHELNPAFALGLQQPWLCQRSQGRSRRRYRDFNRAIELDPTGDIFTAAVALPNKARAIWTAPSPTTIAPLNSVRTTQAYVNRGLPNKPRRSGPRHRRLQSRR